MFQVEFDSPIESEPPKLAVVESAIPKHRGEQALRCLVSTASKVFYLELTKHSPRKRLPVILNSAPASGWS